MAHNGTCFDESFYYPDEVGLVMPFVEIDKESDCSVKSKVFVHLSDGSRYELKMIRVADANNENKTKKMQIFNEIADFLIKANNNGEHKHGILYILRKEELAQLVSLIRKLVD